MGRLRVGAPPAARDWASSRTHVLAFGQHRPHHVGSLLDDGRAGRVDDHAARSHAVHRTRQERALEPSEHLDVCRPTAPPALGAAAQRAETGAGASTGPRSKLPGGPGRPGAVPGDDIADGRPQRLAGPAWRGVAGARWPAVGLPAAVASAASSAALPPGPAHRSSQCSSRPVDGARRQGERDQLGAGILHPGPALAHGGDRPGSPDSRTTASGETAGRRHPAAAAPRPWTARPRTRVTRGRSLSAGAGPRAPRAGRAPAERLDDPVRVGVSHRPRGVEEPSRRPGRARRSGASPRW